MFSCLNRILKLAKGFRGRSKNTIRTATHRVEKALGYAFKGRKQKKRQYRRLWISRINAAARLHGLSYSKFMAGLAAANVELDRKTLSEMGINNPEAFAEVVAIAKQSAN